MSLWLQPKDGFEPVRSGSGGVAEQLRTLVALLGLAVACTVVFFLPRAFSPWHWFYDENGALYGLMGANYQHTGLWATRGGAQHWTTFEGPTRAPEFYSTHPPLLPWLCGISQWLLGIRPVAVRLVPTLGQLLSLIPLFLLGRRLFGETAAAWGVLVYVLLPMTAYFGFAVCYESLNNMFILWAVYWYVRINDDGESWSRVVALVLSLMAGMWTDWPAYFVAMGIGAGWFLTHRRWRRLWAAVPWGTGLISFFLFAAFIYQLGGLGTGGVGSLMNAFRNRTGIASDEPYSWVDLAAFLAEQNLELYGPGLILLVWGLSCIREHRALHPLFILLATAAIHVIAFSYGAMTHEYWTYYFVGPTALGAMALFVRFERARHSIRWFSLACVALAVQSALVIADYNSGSYRRWCATHIDVGKKIAQRAGADQVILMSFAWGDGAIIAYYAQRPIVRVLSTEDLEHVRRHPDYRGGYLILTSQFIVGDGEELLNSLECVDEQEFYGDQWKILYVPQPDTRSSAAGRETSS